jgi:hypothetical protein
VPGIGIVGGARHLAPWAGWVLSLLIITTNLPNPNLQALFCKGNVLDGWVERGSSRCTWGS